MEMRVEMEMEMEMHLENAGGGKSKAARRGERFKVNAELHKCGAFPFPKMHVNLLSC